MYLRPAAPTWLTQLYYILTATGVILHELAHKHAAEDMGLTVTEYRLFQLGNPAGYVKHETPRTYRGMLAVSAAPFLFNTATAFGLYLAIGIAIHYRGLETLPHPQIVLLLAGGWVALSSSLHAFPSSQDISNIWTSAMVRWEQTPFGARGILGIFAMPLFALKHPTIILSLPLIAVLVVLDRTTAIGSHVAFAGLILTSAFYTLNLIYPFLIATF